MCSDDAAEKDWSRCGGHRSVRRVSVTISFIQPMMRLMSIFSRHAADDRCRWSNAGSPSCADFVMQLRKFRLGWVAVSRERSYVREWHAGHLRGAHRGSSIARGSSLSSVANILCSSPALTSTPSTPARSALTQTSLFFRHRLLLLLFCCEEDYLPCYDTLSSSSYCRWW